MPADPKTILFTADRGDARLRLDRILVRHVRDVSRLSRTGVQGWIREGAVTINGRQAKRPSARVQEGAVIAVVLAESVPRRAVPRPEPLDLHLLYEDDWLIAINKPAGVVVHPSYMNQSGTLLNALLWKVQHQPAVRLGLVNRLDKGTSGVVLVALSPQVHARIQHDATAGNVEKHYLALVRGTPRPRSGSIELPLARDPLDRRRVIVAPDGAYSKTCYETVRSGVMREDQSRGRPRQLGAVTLRRRSLQRYTLLRCELATGRTHQIRVHLSARGWPIVGDPLYGVPFDGLTHQALHARRMTLRHPATGEMLEIEAPLPADWPSGLVNRT